MPITIRFAWTAGPVMLMLLVLPVGPRGYGLYTMVAKLGLGMAGLARVSTFAPAVYAAFALGCTVAALLLFPRLTPAPTPGFPAR